MAAVDALSLDDGLDGDSAKRWIVGGAFAIVLHACALYFLRQAPEPVGFEAQTAVELDLMPPPSGEAQMQEAGADQSTIDKPEELPEISADDAPPPPDSETIATEPPQDLPPIDQPPPVAETETPPEDLPPIDEPPPVAETPTPQVAQTEIPPDVVAAPPDVEPAVTLPPENTVVAREEQVEPPKPPPPPVAKKAEPKPEPRPEKKPEPKPQPKPEPKKETARAERTAPPKRDAKPADKPAPASVAQKAGGRGGASADPGAARAAASAYGSRVRAAVASQKRNQPGLVGRAIVTFTVTRGGGVSRVSASGPPAVAAEAQAMVRRASIPPMPAEMTGGSATYSVPISFSTR